MKIIKIPVWNGLINYNYKFISYLVKTYTLKNILYQKWIGIYDIQKGRVFTEDDWQHKIHKISHSFLYKNQTGYAVLEFDSTPIERDYIYDQFPTIFNKEQQHFDSIEKVIGHLNSKKVTLKKFQPPHNQYYPLFHTTWNE